MLYEKMQRVSVIISIVHKYQRLVALCLLESCNSYASDSKPFGIEVMPNVLTIRKGKTIKV